MTIANPIAAATMAPTKAPAKAQERRRGRPKGGDATRARLIEAAGRLFSEAGYSATSTRRICRAAGVNLSAIGYHFGGKQQLYDAIIDAVITDMAPLRQRLIDTIASGLSQAGGDRDALARLLGDVVQGILLAMLRFSEPAWRMHLTARTLAHKAPGFERLMAGHINPIHDALANLVAAATGREADDEECLLLTEAMVAQCLSVVFGRAVILNRLGWDDYDDDHIARIIRTLTPAIQTMLGLPATPAVGHG